MRLHSMTTPRLMVAVVAAATTLGLGTNTVSHTHFRRLATNSVAIDFGDPRDLSRLDRLIRTYCDVMANAFDRTADLLGEPLGEDPFPDQTFEQIRAAIDGGPNRSSIGGIPADPSRFRRLCHGTNRTRPRVFRPRASTRTPASLYPGARC
jgi:hypothetical protein